MKNRIIFIALAAVLAISCAQRPTEVEIIPIQDNVTPRLMQRGLFADAPDSLFEALGLQDGIPSSVCAFLAKCDGKNVLFDAANGAHDSQLLPVLAFNGVTPEDVDYIFITHLHGDHIGGLMKDGTAVFTDAELYINKVEYDAWMAMEQNAALVALTQAYGDRLNTFALDDTLPCGIEAMEAYGHTPGHTVYKVGSALIVGDIMHGVALQLENPQYCARFDMDHGQSVATRKRIMEMAADSGFKLYGMHFPEPYYLQ
ncbi:MAG: MBL fold metallo-hydrolase [Bacteroidales bacterium]|nr:MBL fold metallo-hydrolase [Bacteroidales bacterium]